MTAIIAAPAKARRKQPLWTQLWVWVLIAMALGIALGIAAPDVAGQMGPLGDAFIKLIRMLIAPIIFCTVVTGIAHMADMARVGRVAIKAIIYFEVMTTIALIIGLLAVNILQPGAGMNVDVSKLNPSVVEPYVKLTHEVGFVPFLVNIIPSTFVGAFTEGNILQVLFIAVLSGFALVWLGERAKPLVDVIDVASKMLFIIVGIVMWTAPIGAFGAIAFTVGKFGVGSLASLGKLILGFYLTCVVFIAVGFAPLARLCGFSLLKLIRYIKEELLDLHRHHVVRDGAAAHHGQARAAWLREKRGRAGGADGLFIQSRRHLSLPRDRGRVSGSSHQHAARYLASDRIASHPAPHLEGGGRRSGCRLRGPCGDAWSRKQHTGRERRLGAGHPPPNVPGTDADQSPRQCSRNHRDGQVGRRARRETSSSRSR